MGSVVMAIIAPLSGRVADRYPPRLIAGIGVAAVFVTVLLALTLGDSSTLSFVTLLLVIQGIGFSFFSSPNMALIMSSVPHERGGMASALSAKARSLGMVGGMLVTTLMISYYLGNAPITSNPERFMSVLKGTFSFLAVTTALALVLSGSGMVGGRRSVR
jgi:MFS family permease